MSGNAVAKNLQLTLPAKSEHWSVISRSGNNNNKFNDTTIQSTQRGVSEVVTVSDVELEQSNEQKSKDEDK